MEYPFRNIGYLITERCNKTCKHCGLLIPEIKNPEETTYKEFLQTILCTSIEVKRSVKIVILTGGEPLLHPNIVKIIIGCLEHFPNSKIRVLTNGKLFSSEYVDLVKKEKRLYFVISEYKGWNDEEVKEYKNTHSNISILHSTVFWKPDFNFSISNEKAKSRAIECTSGGGIRFFKNKVYYCCMGKSLERRYNTQYGIPVKVGWEEDLKNTDWWKGCKKCWVSSDGSNYKKYLEIDN